MERNGELFKFLGLSVSDATKPGFLDKVKSACQKRADNEQSKRALAIFQHKLAKTAYLRFCCSETSFYEVIGVDASADIRDIKRTAKRLLLKFHVDKWGERDEIVQKFATEITQFLNTVIATLTDPDKRHEEAEEVSDVDSEAEAREFFGSKKKSKTHNKDKSTVIKLTLHEFYVGKIVRDIDMGEGNKATVTVPRRSVPGWSTVLAPPGRIPVRITFQLKTGSLDSFFVDDHMRLCCEVDIEPINAICGRGDITAATPDGRTVKTKLMRPVNNGDIAAVFEGEGFGKNAMYGIASVRERVHLSESVRDRLWKAYKNEI